MNGDEKQSVRDALRAHVAAAMRATGRDQRTDHDAAQLDPGAQYTVDDLSQSDDAGEFVELDGGLEAEQAATLAEIDALDLGPKSSVAPGAIIEFDGDRYVVGVAASEFTDHGRSYTGLAVDAPIYAAIDGLHAGDEFSFRGLSHRIDAVW